MPQGNITPSASASLDVAGEVAPDADTRRVYALFPRLANAPAMPTRTLSGGNSDARHRTRLMTNPDLILMDEPTEGLARCSIRQVGG